MLIKLYIRIIALTQPILKSTDKPNLAIGRIKNFKQNQELKKIPVGGMILSSDQHKHHKYTTIWVHLGWQYYKCIGRWICEDENDNVPAVIRNNIYYHNIPKVHCTSK